MAEAQKQEEFEFEIENEVAAPEVDRRSPEQIRQDQIDAAKQQTKGKPEPEVKDDDVEVVDDTPEEDRNRTPLPKKIVDELEADELEDYSEKVKTRLMQMKKVWHDERREKERALREQQEVLALAQKLMEENKSLRGTVNQRETALAETMKEAAERALKSAKNEVRDAYQEGDAEKIAEAQEKLAAATLRAAQADKFTPTPLQQPETEVQSNLIAPQTPRLDEKTSAWINKNPWWGTDPEMTALALGYHQKLEREFGVGYVNTDEYWRKVDETMRRRFPDYDWGEEEIKTTNGGGKPVVRTEKPAATVVAPASRSTSSKKIVLKQSQVAVAKKLGLTPEQYAREFAKLENQNG
jgi:hypothetical protein